MLYMCPEALASQHTSPNQQFNSVIWLVSYTKEELVGVFNPFEKY